VLEQSMRHANISVLLGIPHLVVAVNKLDLVEHSQARFEELVGDFEGFVGKLAAMRSTGATGSGVAGDGAAGGADVDDVGADDGRLALPDVTYIPISALDGDNVVERSRRMDWYQDPARHPVLLDLLEEVEVAYDHPHERPARFPVQWVIRPENRNRSTAGGGDYRGYAGQLASGSLRVGEEVVVLPSGQRTRIAAIDTYEGELEEALAPMSVTLRLEDELDVSRGELICRPEQSPTVARELEADVCWLNERPLRAGGRYVIKHTTRTATAIVDELGDRVDVSTLERVPAPAELELNDIGRVRLRTSAPLAFDPYIGNRRTGSFILIDEATNETVGAGMVGAAGA
jgi:sulfate adenylyltransferase subunit 1 (EFTu-like GTPase family)